MFQGTFYGYDLGVEISLDSAQRIVSEISSVLGADVNLIDRSAAIIASTDARRVGNHHPGAEQIVTHHLEQLIITPDNRLPGTRPGLNLPIWDDNEIAGVLGITGDPATFTTPAHVLQKMTEILLRENRIREEAERHERSSTRFLQAWLSDSRELTPELIDQGREFNIDVRADYLIAAANVVAVGSPAVDVQGEIDRVTERFLDAATSYGASSGMLGSRIILLFPQPADDADITTWLNQAARKVRSTTAVKLAVGISGTDVRPPEAADQAVRALRHALHSPVDVHRFDGLTLELLFAAIPERERQAFTKRVFRDAPAETRYYLKAYFDADGSLSRASEALFVHKNTLNGRLHRIAETTGFDPRRVADAAVLWLALQIGD